MNALLNVLPSSAFMQHVKITEAERISGDKTLKYIISFVTPSMPSFGILWVHTTYTVAYTTSTVIRQKGVVGYHFYSNLQTR